MTMIEPFANQSESWQIEGFTFENRSDKVSIYGDIDITRDRKGLDAARKLAAVLNAIVDRLSSEQLPDSIPVADRIDTIKNPFD